MKLIFANKMLFFIVPGKIKENSSNTPCTTLIQLHLAFPNRLAPKFTFKNLEYLFWYTPWYVHSYESNLGQLSLNISLILQSKSGLTSRLLHIC